ncbi:MAG: hypothetical protein IT331_08445 [Anaerolineae bacterium]|nr:hypothetical protein [Anaerolineae bacterium]
MQDQIIARAPTRLDFVGGWTDVQPFCDAEQGLVVNAAFGVITRVSVRLSESPQPNTDRFVQAACRRFGVETLDVSLRSDAPVGSGLGGSGAAGVVLVGALGAVRAEAMTRREIADLAHDIEVQDLGMIGGKQDQYAAAFGGFLALEFLGDAVQVKPLDPGLERVRELESRSVVVYTGQSRVSGNIHANVQAAFRAGNPDTLQALATIREVARRFCGELQNGSIDALGDLLNANWEAQKRLHPSTTNERVEAFFEIARNAGAAGGKALGAGGGGCLYFLARAGDTQHLKQALTAAGGQVLDAGFDFQGLVVETRT